MSIKRLIIILFECLFRFLKLRFKQKLDMRQEGKAIRNVQNCLGWHCNLVHEIKLLTLFWFLFIKLIQFHTKTKITFILKQLTPYFKRRHLKFSGISPSIPWLSHNRFVVNIRLCPTKKCILTLAWPRYAFENWKINILLYRRQTNSQSCFDALG